MKKLFSTLLTLVFVFSLGSIAVADTDPPVVAPTDISSIEVPKWYGPLNGPTTSFNFEIEKLDVTDQGDDVSFGNMPVPSFETEDTPISFPVDKTDLTRNATLNLPTYSSVGIYRYLITEVVPSPAVPWVGYDNRGMILKVTVLQGPNGFIRIPAVRFGTLVENEWVMEEKKGGQFENDYLAGELTLNKQVTGNLGDREKYFSFAIRFDAPEGFTLDNTINISSTSYENTDGDPGNPSSVTFSGASVDLIVYLKHGETINFTNIPVGVTYTITEETYSDYTTTNNIDPANGLVVTGNIAENEETDAVVFTNDKTTQVDTGISLDSIPYIMILGLAILGISGLFLKRRKNANF